MISPCDELSVKISPFSARQRETVKEKIGAFVHVGMREAPECLVPGHIPVRLREVLKAEKRRFYIGSTFAEICPGAFPTYNTNDDTLPCVYPFPSNAVQDFLHAHHTL